MANDFPEELPDDALEQERLKEHLRDLLFQQFQPSKSSTFADHMFSTDEVFHIVNNHSPDLVPKYKLRDLLIILGFKERFMTNAYVWLMDQAR